MSNMIIRLSDAIYLPTNLPHHVLEPILDDLTIINPKYIEERKFNRPITTIPMEIKLYEQTNKQIRLPRGYLFHLIKKLKNRKVPFTFHDETISIETKFKLKGNLRSYQKEAVDRALKYRQGVLISPCGSGKTVMGIFFLAMTKEKTLWITHTKDLMYQTIERMEELLSIPYDEIGKIGDGMNHIGEKITVGLVQSLVQLDKSVFRNGFGTIVIDEAHRVPSKTFHTVVDISAAKYRLGLTATPKRKDGLESVLYRVVGQPVYEITEHDLLEENQIMIPEIKKLYTDFYSPAKNYQQLIRELVENEERNALITHTIKETMEAREVALVLTNRLEHCRYLAARLRQLSPEWTVAVLTGEVSKGEREAILEGARKGTIQIIIATQIADEGLDIPNLNKLYLVTPTKSKAKLKQQIGRIMRKDANKGTPTVYDFIDRKIPLLKRHANIRNLVYNDLNCQ